MQHSTGQRPSLARMPGVRAILLTTASLFAIGLFAACSALQEKSADAGPASSSAEDASGASALPPEQRQALFGETHLHTAYSFDAYGFTEARIGPDLAYRFARGEPIEYLGKMVRRHDPLDFMVVTDHGEFMGVLNELDDPNSAVSKGEIGRRYREASANATGFAAFYSDVRRMVANPANIGTAVTQAMTSAWEKSIAMANANYQPGKFTTFIGYEWTSHPQDRYNLHRNVIFRGDSAPMPFTATDSLKPEDLWTYLEANRANGVEALAIPHNANGSEGNMFAWTDSDGRPIDATYSRRRALNEPLNEMAQNKGQSETLPMLSPSDEFANFEVMDRLVPNVDAKGSPPGSYVRDALGRGLVIEQRTGVNPYKLGAAGGTDFHNALSTAREDSFVGAFGFDPAVNPPGRKDVQGMLGQPAGSASLLFGSGALTGVWAERNDRPSIYAAMRRKETFATSGTRLKVRLFGGWDYRSDLVRQRDWVSTAYKTGAPMGSDLPARPTRAKAPTFAVWAVKDPNGANIDRAQIIKVWLDGATPRERVFDVALSDNRRIDPKTGKPPVVGDTVDRKSALYSNSIGAVELSTVWTDPTFDPQQPAVYYLRVIEIPTPRWSTILAAKYELPIPSGLPATLQERAWSSPIWYTPAQQAR